MDLAEIKACVRAEEYVYTSHGDLERKADDLTLAQVEDALVRRESRDHHGLCPNTTQVHRSMDPRAKRMTRTHCTSCGSVDFETRNVEYLYSHQRQYLLVPDTPAEVCQQCGTVFYDAKVLKEIERRFLAIQSHGEEPERYLRIPTIAYA